MDIEIISLVNGKLTVMSCHFEIMFQKKGNNGVKVIRSINHNGGKDHFIPTKYRKPAEKEAIRILCNEETY